MQQTQQRPGIIHEFLKGIHDYGIIFFLVPFASQHERS